MPDPMKIERFDLQELLSFIENKEVSIPEFQRGYVWKEIQVKKLFDSLINKYPIGSLIIWKTNQKVGPRYLFIKEAKGSKEKYFILDGQQRLLSLYYLCKQNNFQKVKDLFQEISESPQSPIEFEHFYFENLKVPKLEYSKEKTCEFNFEDFKKRLGKKYLFPVIIVAIDDFKKAIEVFERVNQAGTRISTESIFLSETWNKQSNLGKILRLWKKENNNNLSGKLENIIFIHTLAIILQLEKVADDNEFDPNNVETSLRQLKRIAEKIREEKSKLYEKYLKKTLKAVNLAMSFLKKEFKIRNVNELPSQTMVTLLSVFSCYCDRNLTEGQKKELRKWFWRSALSSRYIGAGYNKNIRRDPIKMKRLAINRKKLNIPSEDIKFNDLMDTDIKVGKSTLRNCVKLMLWMKKPKWINKSHINPDEVEVKKKKKEDDHFYPYNLFRKKVIKSENEINTILNLIFLTKQENTIKQDLLPSIWLDKRKKELEPKLGDEKIFFQTNLLPFETIEGLKRKDSFAINKDGTPKPLKLRYRYEKFLKNRFKLIKKELNRLQNGKEIEA